MASLASQRAKGAMITLALKNNANFCARCNTRSFGVSSKVKDFIQWFNNPWFSRMFRAIRMSSLLFAVGGSAYAYGQIQLLDDPFGHQESTRHQILRSMNSEFCSRFLDNEDLTHDEVGIAFC